MKTTTSTTSTTTRALAEQLHTARLLLADALRILGLTTARLSVARSGNWPTRAYASDVHFARNEARDAAQLVALLEMHVAAATAADDVVDVAA